MASDYSKMYKARQQYGSIFKTYKERKYKPRIVYPVKISFKRLKAIGKKEKSFKCARTLYTYAPSEDSIRGSEASSNQKVTGKCGKVLTTGENFSVFFYRF